MKPDTTGRVTVGIDFGGTGVKLGLVQPDGVVVARHSFPTSEASSQARWIARVSSVIHELSTVAGRTPVGVGVGVPGFVDVEKGHIYDLPNVPGWTDCVLGDLLSTALGLPVRIDNDVNVMALGECTFGVGREYRNAVFVTLGTGVGGGILIDGKLYRGAHHMAGEIGHVSIDRNGIRSPQGIGGLEQYVGNRPLVERCRAELAAGRASSIRDLVGPDLSTLSMEHIGHAAAAGDALGGEIFDFMAQCLATAFASVAYLIQPEAIIVGGGVSASGKVLFEPLQRHLRERLSPVFFERLAIRPARLGNDAGLLGASVLARS